MYRRNSRKPLVLLSFLSLGMLAIRKYHIDIDDVSEHQVRKMLQRSKVEGFFPSADYAKELEKYFNLREGTIDEYPERYVRFKEGQTALWVHRDQKTGRYDFGIVKIERRKTENSESPEQQVFPFLAEGAA